MKHNYLIALALIATAISAEPALISAAKPACKAEVPRSPDGQAGIVINGELKQWHKVTLTLDGPFAPERGTPLNAFYRSPAPGPSSPTTGALRSAT